jgi:hypothetical protein
MLRRKMMETETLTVGVVMQRCPVASRWQSHQWRPRQVLVDRPYPGVLPHCIIESNADTRWQFSGLEVRLHSDEAEGYFLNAGAPVPCWFIMSRPQEIGGQEMPVPQTVTLSYNEAARLMDGGEQVETLPLPAPILERLQEFVDRYYRPEIKHKRKKPSFEGGAGVERMAQAEGNHGR